MAKLFLCIESKFFPFRVDPFQFSYVCILNYLKGATAFPFKVSKSFPFKVDSFSEGERCAVKTNRNS